MGYPSPSPESLPCPDIEPTSLMSPALAGQFFTASTTWEARIEHTSGNFLYTQFKKIAHIKLKYGLRLKVFIHIKIKTETGADIY